MTMPYTKKIDDEARILSKFPDDIDNFRRFYSMKETNNEETINIRFCAPSIIALENNRFYLLANSNKKPLKPSNYYRPDYVSYEEYGTTNLWSMILFINNIPSIEEFNKEDILVPTASSVLILSDRVAGLNIDKEIVPLHTLEPKATPNLFTQKILIPEYKDNVIQPPIIPTPSISFVREPLYTVDVVTVRERYVNLTYEPLPSTVTIKTEGGTNYLYGKHYTIIKGNKGYNRLTWDPRQLTSGVGMVSVLTEGTQFEVTYTRKV